MISSQEAYSKLTTTTKDSQNLETISISHVDPVYYSLDYTIVQTELTPVWRFKSETGTKFYVDPNGVI